MNDSKLTRSTTTKVSNTHYEKVKTYADATGVSISRILDDAIDYWMLNVGNHRLKILTNKEGKR